jgi:hypothetical protein
MAPIRGVQKPPAWCHFNVGTGIVVASPGIESGSVLRSEVSSASRHVGQSVGRDGAVFLVDEVDDRSLG